MVRVSLIQTSCWSEIYYLNLPQPFFHFSVWFWSDISFFGLFETARLTARDSVCDPPLDPTSFC